MDGCTLKCLYDQATCSPSFLQNAACDIHPGGITCATDCRTMRANCAGKSVPIELGTPQFILIHPPGPTGAGGTRTVGFLDATANKDYEVFDVEVTDHPHGRSQMLLTSDLAGGLTYGHAAWFAFSGKPGYLLDAPTPSKATCVQNRAYRGIIGASPKNADGCFFSTEFFLESDAQLPGAPVSYGELFYLRDARNASTPFAYLTYMSGDDAKSRWRYAPRDHATRFSIQYDLPGVFPNDSCLFIPTLVPFHPHPALQRAPSAVRAPLTLRAPSAVPVKQSDFPKGARRAKGARSPVPALAHETKKTNVWLLVLIAALLGAAAGGAVMALQVQANQEKTHPLANKK